MSSAVKNAELGAELAGTPLGELFSDRGIDAAERIRSAAVYLFATRGFAATSIRDICSLVNLTTAGVYHHVANKQALLADIMISGQRSINSTTRNALATAATPERALGILVSSLTAIHGLYPMLARVTDGELRSLEEDTPGHHDVMRLRADYEGFWRSTLRSGTESGCFTITDESLTRLALMAMCTGTSVWFRPNGPRPLESVCSEFVRIALASVRTVGVEPGLDPAVDFDFALIPHFDWEPSAPANRVKEYALQ